MEGIEKPFYDFPLYVRFILAEENTRKSPPNFGFTEINRTIKLTYIWTSLMIPKKGAATIWNCTLGNVAAPKRLEAYI